MRGFHNFLSYQRDWLDASGTGDCQGQAVRALAEVLGSDLPEGYRALARELIEDIVPALAELRSLRAQAYVIMAWGHLMEKSGERHRTTRACRMVGGAAIDRVLRAFECALTGNGSNHV